MNYAIWFIYLGKICLSGLTMYILLKNRTGNDKFITVVFSTCYSLCCFIINYFFCVFWFDCMYCAPLVVLGIERIIKEEKINLLYIFSLALAIMCNIQMGFGLCVFSVLYFLYTFNSIYGIKEEFTKFKQVGLLFIVSSLCAGGISSGILLGFVYDYSTIVVARSLHVTTSAAVTGVGYLLKNLFTVGNLTKDYFNNFEPYASCGLLVSFFSMLFLFDKNIDKRKKLSAFCVILVFIISFGIQFLNLFWHLSSPVLLNYRYSAYLGLFLTIIAHECYINKEQLIKKDIIVLSVFLLVGLFMPIAYSNEVYEVYTYIFLLLIYGLIILTKNKSKSIEVLLIIAIIAELCFNGYLSLYTASDLLYGQYGSLKQYEDVASWDTFDNNYRVMYDYSYTDNSNDSLLTNKNSSLRYFSSVINGNVLNFYHHNLSTVGNNNYKVSAYDTPLLLSLMGNKYFYMFDDFNHNLFNKLYSRDIDVYSFERGATVNRTVSLYENPYALTLGYVIEKDAKFKDSMDLVDYQNEIIKSFTGIDEDVTVRLNYTYNNAEPQYCTEGYYTCRQYNITNNTNNKSIYIYTLFDAFNLFGDSTSYFDAARPLVINSLSKNASIIIKYTGYVSDQDFVASTYNESSLIKALKTLQENMLSDIEIDKNVMNAKIDSKKDGILFLSIPYEDSFKITVDGKEVEYYSLLDGAFVGLDITTGKHDIKIEYVNNKYIVYIACSVVSLIVTLVLYHFINSNIKKRKDAEEKAMQELLESRKNKKLAKEEKKKNKKKK